MEQHSKDLNVGKQLKEKKERIKLSIDFIEKHKILTPFKCGVLRSDSTNIDIIAAKGNGKTLLAIIKAYIMMDHNPKSVTAGFRKNKDLASETLGDYFYRINSLLQIYGYKPKYPQEQRRNKYYLLKNKKNMKENQYAQFFSLEDYTKTDGANPANLGFFGMVILDELMDKKDMLTPDKIPTKESFDAIMEHIEDNIERFTDSFVRIHKLPQEKRPKYQTWTMTNNWGAHPRTREDEELHPVADFIEWIIGYRPEELLGNKELIDSLIESGEWEKKWTTRTGRSVTVPSLDRDIIRMTKFENPDNLDNPQKKKYILRKIATGFITKNFRILAQFIGMEFAPEIPNEMKVYNIQEFNETTLEKLAKLKWQPKEIGYGVDIDTSNMFTIAPAYLMETVNYDIRKGEWIKNKAIFLDRIIELPALGSGEFGELHPMNADMIAKVIKKHLILASNQYGNTLKRSHMVVDDNRKHYLGLLRERLYPLIKSFTMPIKNGHYEIVERQDLMENGFKTQKIFLHEKNQQFKDDINLCIKADIASPKRKTSGSTNHLDIIDSAEYVIYLWLGVLIKSRIQTNRNIGRKNELIY